MIIAAMNGDRILREIKSALNEVLPRSTPGYHPPPLWREMRSALMLEQEVTERVI